MIDFILVGDEKVQFGFYDGSYKLQSFNSKSNYFSDDWKTLVRTETQDHAPTNIFFQSGFSTLIPLDLFNPSLSSDVFKLNFGNLLPENHVSFDQIYGLNVANIYNVPEWLNSFKTTIYPLVPLKHISSQFLNRIRHNAGNSIIALLSDKLLTLSVWKENKLLHFNHYEINGALDLVYYVLLQFKEWNGPFQPKIQFFYNNPTFSSIEIVENLKLVNEFEHASIEHFTEQQTLKSILCA